MIELQHLSKTFRSRRGDGTIVKAIEDINLTVDDGDIFGIIGLSGAGKSTLIRCINYLERPTEGKVIFDGLDLGSLTTKELRKTRRSMSMVFQSFNLLAQRTALKNICYPMEIAGVPRDKALNKARELLKIVGLSDKEKFYPSQLSGGQKQRVAIARALATDPKVLLCDEATSALDPNTTRSILDLLKEINRTMGVTIIVITHEMKVIERICNKVAVLDKSHIVESGSVAEVFSNPQSQIARELIMPHTMAVESVSGGEKIRIIFDGESSTLPVVSNLVLECHVPVNILFADTRDIDGKAFGQMLLQLPEDSNKAEAVTEYLTKNNIKFKRED